MILKLRCHFKTGIACGCSESIDYSAFYSCRRRYRIYDSDIIRVGIFFKPVNFIHLKFFFDQS